MSNDDEIIQLEDLQIMEDPSFITAKNRNDEDLMKSDFSYTDDEFAEKRIDARLNFMFDIEVFNAVSDEYIGDLVNFSHNGLLLISENPIKIDTPFQLRIVIPYEINGKQEIRVKATSVRCNEDSYPLLFNIGFKMTDVSPEENEIIYKMITEAGC